MGLYTLIHTKIEKLPIFRKFALRQGRIRLVIARRPPTALVAAAFPSTFAIYAKMPKRKASGDRSGKSVSLELDEEQIAALQLIPDGLHPQLKCLVPVLDSIRKAYSDVIPPHRRALPVNTIISNDQKAILTF